jgi:hypothetical protein
MLTIDHINYLRGLVRKEIRWREDSLEKFTIRPGQTVEEAAEVKSKISYSLRRSQKVLEELDKLSLRAAKLASDRTKE